MTRTPGFTVYTSHRLEDLALVLAELLGAAPLAPLATETVIVPGQGMAHWLRLQLAERHGIAAGLELPFPGAFLQRLAQRDTDYDADPWTPDVLAWRIWRLLGDPAHQTELAAAAAYCSDDADGRKRFQLSQRLAACFDDYQLYRDDLLAAFARGDTPKDLGPHAAWQGALWRALLADVDPAAAARTEPKRRRTGGRRGDVTPLLFQELAAPSSSTAADRVPLPAHRLAALRDLLTDPARARAALPERLCVFGAGSLPPAFLAMLLQVAEHVPVALFAPAPSPHFLGELRGKGRADHPLLARFCTEAREFGDQLLQLEERAGDVPFVRHALDADPAVDAQPPTLLQCLQRDLVAVAARGEPGGPKRYRLSLDDASLRVHDCHSPMRELEVVRDHVLAAFAADATLQPHDVLVLVPDIATYAPYAHAVFGPVAKFLPFQVADRDPASDLPLCASLLSVLQLAQERLVVFDVLHLLENPAVQRRFGLSASDLPVLQDRCERAGIRWGLDGAMRERQFRVPAFDENAWLPGLDRLLLGLATGPVDELVAGVLPVADVTDGRTDLLVRFVWFARTLFAQLQPLQRPHPLAEWADLLDGALCSLFAPGPEDAPALAHLQKLTAQLRTAALRAELREPVTPAVLGDWLASTLQRATGTRGFLGGAVTVAALLPMRTVPVRHLYVCGLSDQSFPRRDQPLPFDLTANAPRPGDRSVRLDDRQMFLDTLLAARDQLHLSYVGHSAKDDSPCAPSSVLSELLDHLDRTCEPPAGRTTVREAVVVAHPLQPWSVRYRDGRDPRLFTYARHDAVARAQIDAPPWLTGDVSAPEAAEREVVPLEQLLAFWRNPCRYFLEHTLQLRVRREEDRDRDTEPFVVDNLDRWRLQDALVRRAERGEPDPEDGLALARATGQLPVGGAATFAYAPIAEGVEQFVHQVAQYGERRSVPVVARTGDTLVRGELSGVTAQRLVHARIAKLKSKDKLRAWIEHVVAAVARDQGHAELPQESVAVGKDACFEFRMLEPSVAHAQLASLVSGFRLGQRQPLPFFEHGSHDYASALPDRVEAEHKARRAWAPNDTDRGAGSDGDDPAQTVSMRGRDPFALAAFATWAEAIWRVALDHGRKL